MNRTLTLKIFVHQEHGLSMTVKKTVVSGGDDGEKETTTTEKTDAWAPSIVCSAIEELVTEYLGELGSEVEETPIEKAIKA